MKIFVWIQVYQVHISLDPFFLFWANLFKDKPLRSRMLTLERTSNKIVSFSIIPLFPVVSLIEFEISFPTELRKFFAFFLWLSWAVAGWLLLSRCWLFEAKCYPQFCFAALARNFFLSLIWKTHHSCSIS